MIAELAAFGKSFPWPYQEPSAEDADVAYWVDWLDAQQDIQRLWTGRLEALLARHWPELTRLLGLTSVTLLRMLRHYGGPGEVAADPASAEQLAKWGRVTLKATKIQEVVASAERTVGLRQGPREQERMRQYASACLAAYRETQVARRELDRLAKGNEVLRRQGKVVGTATACVLRVAVGDPRDYASGAAYRKAMGLNLKERSSGEYQGRLKITKRGPSIARRWLYFAAMRQIQDSPVRRWYEAKKAKDQGRGKGALIAVMRKLALALHAVGAEGQRFEPCACFRAAGWHDRRNKPSASRKRPWEARPGRVYLWKTGEEAIFPVGALPPNPRDLSRAGQSRRWEKKDGRSVPPALRSWRRRRRSGRFPP